MIRAEAEHLQFLEIQTSGRNVDRGWIWNWVIWPKIIDRGALFMVIGD